MILVLSLYTESQAQVAMKARLPFGSPEEKVTKKIEKHPSRAFFEKKLKECRQQMAQTTGASQRLELLKKSLSEIESFRKNHKMSDVTDEIYMNLVSRALLELPEPREFHSDQCGLYRKLILRDYEPTAADSQVIEDPAVADAVKILSEVCS